MSGFGSTPGQPGGGYGSTPGQPGGGYGSAPAAPVGAPGFGAPAGQPGGTSPLSAQGLENTRELAKWMKFFGIVNIVIGASYCLTLAGAVFGWLPLLMGYWKLKASQDILRFAEASDTSALESSINFMRLYYLTIGIMTIISLSLTALMIIGYILMVVVFGMAMFGAAAASGS
jgi:hypothetical protein